ncbi:MAG: LD-carboxypeptidase [Desulfococcaceae bacterium]
MEAEYRIPEPLLPGDIIGIAAPAGPCDRMDVEQGGRLLESAGYSVLIPDGLFEKNSYLAGTDAHRAGIINRLFADDAVKAIFCARGGYGSMRILPLLDRESIRRHPKIFAGFSDITALLSFFQNQCGMVCFHGPVLSTLYEGESLDALLCAVRGERILRIYPENAVVLSPGRASGIVSGGNLATLCHLTGTAFQPFFKGQIVILEDWNEPPYKIDRMLTQMKLSGCFSGIRGLILGSFENCGPDAEIRNIIKDVFKDCEMPVMAGFKFGHCPGNITLPLGLRAEMDTDRTVLFFQDSGAPEPGIRI